MIFQEPMTSLNPVMTVGDQIMEAVLLHQQGRQEGRQRDRDSGAPGCRRADPTRRVRQYPHELSGGMRQRIMIAMALSCNPKLIIADEPTTALDVTIQRQILELIKAIQERTGAALLLITHDLGVVAETVDDVAVMYAGRVVETGHGRGGPPRPADAVHARSARVDPVAGQARPAAVGDQGLVPNPFRMPTGCKFEPRCPYAWDQCIESEPELIQLGEDRTRALLAERQAIRRSPGRLRSARRPEAAA